MAKLANDRLWMDIVQTDITLTKIPSCKSSGFGTWQLSGVLLWFAPAGWWGIGQRQVCLPKDWLSSSSAPWKQKTKERDGHTFRTQGMATKRLQGVGGRKEEYWHSFLFRLSTMVLYLCHNERDAENISCLRCFFRSDQWLEVGQRPACWWMRGSGRTKDDLA